MKIVIEKTEDVICPECKAFQEFDAGVENEYEKQECDSCGCLYMLKHNLTYTTRTLSPEEVRREFSKGPSNARKNLLPHKATRKSDEHRT